MSDTKFTSNAMSKDDELHITCSCHTHELHVEKDSDLPSPMWYISFWQRGYVTENTWKWRFRCIWQILTKGRPYGDEVLLEYPEMVELQKYVNAQVEKAKK